MAMCASSFAINRKPNYFPATFVHKLWTISISILSSYEMNIIIHSGLHSKQTKIHKSFNHIWYSFIIINKRLICKNYFCFCVQYMAGLIRALLIEVYFAYWIILRIRHHRHCAKWVNRMAIYDCDKYQMTLFSRWNVATVAHKYYKWPFAMHAIHEIQPNFSNPTHNHQSQTSETTFHFGTRLTYLIRF